MGSHESVPQTKLRGGALGTSIGLSVFFFEALPTGNDHTIQLTAGTTYLPTILIRLKCSPGSLPGVSLGSPAHRLQIPVD